MSRKHIPPKPLHLTDEKIAAVKEELDYIETTLLPEIRKRMALTYEDGDMPENNPWLTANDDLQAAMKRRNELRHLLVRAKQYKTPILQHVGQDPAQEIGSKLLIRINGGPATAITLVSSEEADPSENKLSIDSPLGKALATATTHTIEVDTPAGRLAVNFNKV